MKLNAYLNFDGKTEEAFNFYKSIFGGEFSALQRFKDAPGQEKPMSKGEGERILHVALPLGDGNTLMGSDIWKGMGMLNPGNNVNLSLHLDAKEEAERIFRELSKGGKVEMAFQKMFWGAYYGAFTDKFGIQWMVNYAEAAK